MLGRTLAAAAMLGLIGCAATTTPKSRVGFDKIVVDEASGEAISLPDTLDKASYAGEAVDSGVSSQTSLKNPPLLAPTPVTHPNASAIYTPEAYSTFRAGDAIFIYVKESDDLTGKVAAIPGSLWWPSAGGAGVENDALQQKLVDELQAVTGGDPTIRIVFYCDRPDCWTPYNAALRLAETPYKNVAWYRGGTSAWYEADLPLEVFEVPDWT